MNTIFRSSLLVTGLFVSQLSFAQGATATSPSDNKAGTSTTAGSDSTKAGTSSTTTDNTRNAGRNKSGSKSTAGKPTDSTTSSSTSTGPNRADCSPSDKGKASQNPNCAGDHNVDPSTVKNPTTPAAGDRSNTGGSVPNSGTGTGN